MENIWGLMTMIVYGFELIGIGIMILFIASCATNGQLPKELKTIYKLIFEFEDEEERN